MIRGRIVTLAVSIVVAAAASSVMRGEMAAPFDPAALRNRGAAFLDNGDDAKAIEVFRDLARRLPDSAPDRVNLGIALINHNDIDGAEVELRAALGKDAKDLRAHYNLGLVLKKRGKNEDAEKEIALVATTPEGAKDATVFYNLGILYRRLRRSDEALAAFRKAVALRPEHGSAHFQIYNELIQRGDKAAAQPELDLFKSLQKATPDFQRTEAFLERGAFTRIDAPGPLPAGAAAGAAVPSGAGKAEIRFERKRGESVATTPGAVAGPGGAGVSAAIADFDGDGALDAAVAGPAVPVRIFKQKPAGSFSQILVKLEIPSVSAGAAVRNLVFAPSLAAGDVDNDGDPDLLVAWTSGVRLYLNDGKGRLTDATKDAGLEGVPGSPAALWFDADRDGDLDLVLGDDHRQLEGSDEPHARPRLFLNAGLYPSDIAPGGSPAAPASARGTAGDQRKSARDPVRLVAAGSEAALPDCGETLAAADLRGRDDADLVFGCRLGRFSIARNLRGGSFKLTPGEAVGPGRSYDGAAAGGASAAPGALAGDFDGDGRADIVSVRYGELAVLWNDGAGAFPAAPTALFSTSSPGAGGGGKERRLLPVLVDVDGDGLLDIAAAVVGPPYEGGGLSEGKASVGMGRRLVILHNEGSRRFKTLDDTAPSLSDIGGAVALLAGDFDNDGDPDLAVVTPDGPPTVLTNVTKTANRFVRVSLKGGKTNRAGIGAKIEIRADRLVVTRESDGNPAIIGIGPRGRADAVRIVWTSGVTQDLVDVPAGPVKIEEKREFSGSCPFLYAWDGAAFRFVSEALSGAPVGFLRPDGAYESPRPTEHLRLAPGLPAPRNGRLSLRMAEEMRELTALDSVRLVAVDHPEGVEVYSNERLTEKVEPFRYVAVADLRAPAAAVETGVSEDRGAGDKGDRRAALAEALGRLDDRGATGFATLGPRLEGLAEPHALVLEFDAPSGAPSAPSATSGRPALVLDGWVAWMTSDVSRALLQAREAATASKVPAHGVRDASEERDESDDGGVSGNHASDAAGGAAAKTETGTFAGQPIPAAPQPWGPALELRWADPSGAQVTPTGTVALAEQTGAADVVFDADLGLPIGASMLAPLPPGLATGKGRLEVRIGTGLAMYYDRVRLGTIVDAPLSLRELRPVEAELRWRGVAAERRARDEDPTQPDYDAVSPLSPFPRLREETTLPGDALDLVSEADGRFVIFGTGEEVTLEFDASGLPPPEPGMSRTWFLVSTGYARDGDPNSKPLPWGPAVR